MIRIHFPLLKRMLGGSRRRRRRVPARHTSLRLWTHFFSGKTHSARLNASIKNLKERLTCTTSVQNVSEIFLKNLSLLEGILPLQFILQILHFLVIPVVWAWGGARHVLQLAGPCTTQPATRQSEPSVAQCNFFLVREIHLTVSIL